MKNLFIISVIIILSLMTAVFGTLPTNLFDFLGALAISLIFWTGMLISGFKTTPKKYSKYGME